LFCEWNEDFDEGDGWAESILVSGLPGCGFPGEELRLSIWFRDADDPHWLQNGR